MIIPVILSGGTGSRLWPISREAHPKPFMKLADGKTLLQKTFVRAAQLDNIAEILTITNREYYFKSKDEYEQTKVTSSAHATFLLEPFARNTASAIAFAAFKAINSYGADSILLVLAADHLIENQSVFAEAVKEACELANIGKLVTFGITPTGPETGYGYIECGAALNGKNSYQVSRFAEKPNVETAQQYISTGRYLWNSGMFCFKASTLLEQLKLHSFELYQQALKCWDISLGKADSHSLAIELDKESFDKLEDISIDYALMEKSKDIAVIASTFDWDDIGSWDAVGRLAEPDQQGNSVMGEAVLVDVSNTFIQSETRMVAALLFLAIQGGATTQAIIILLVMASLLAFLWFNFRFPWRKSALVFMGDAGSMLLGFTLVWFLVDLSQGQHKIIAPAAMLWIMAVPLFDISGVMLRRLQKRQSVFLPDREHLHYLLTDLGFA